MNLSDLEDVSPITELGGDRFGIQGDTATGKSTLAANIALSYGGPVLYFILDPNVKYLGNNIPKDAPISWIKLGLKQDATLGDKQEMLKKINVAWNGFLSSEPSSKWGEPFKAVVWDTHTLLWDFIGPTKVAERIAKSKNPNRDANQMDWGDANSWMSSLSTQQDVYRPDSCMIFLLHEKNKYVQDERGQWVESNIVIPDAWKHTKKHVQVYIRLYRKLKGLGRDGKEKPNVRTGILEKFSPDEDVIRRLGEIAEPEYSDFIELLGGYKN